MEALVGTVAFYFRIQDYCEAGGCAVKSDASRANEIVPQDKHVYVLGCCGNRFYKWRKADR